MRGETGQRSQICLPSSLLSSSLLSPSSSLSYLMHKLDGVLEYGHEIGQTKVSHLLHHWIWVHLKTAVGGAHEVT